MSIESDREDAALDALIVLARMDPREAAMIETRLSPPGLGSDCDVDDPESVLSAEDLAAMERLGTSEELIERIRREVYLR